MIFLKQAVTLLLNIVASHTCTPYSLFILKKKLCLMMNVELSSYNLKFIIQYLK